MDTKTFSSTSIQANQGSITRCLYLSRPSRVPPSCQPLSLAEDRQACTDGISNSTPHQAKAEDPSLAQLRINIFLKDTETYSLLHLASGNDIFRAASRRIDLLGLRVEHFCHLARAEDRKVTTS